MWELLTEHPVLLPIIRWFIITYTHLPDCFVPSVVSCCSCDCFGIVLLFLERIFAFSPDFEPFPSELSPLRLLLDQPHPCAEAEPADSRICDDFAELLNTE